MSYKMVDLANTPEETKEDVAGYSVAMPAEAAAGPKYSYGLCIRLGKNELEKLGMADDLPEVGDTIHVMGMAKVTSVSERETEGGSDCCVEMTFTHMGAEDEDEEDPEERLQRNESRDKERSDSFYDDNDGNEDDE